MNYKKYQASRDLAWRILIDEKICELPISISKICHSLGIVIKYYNPADGNDGCSFIVDGTPTIFISRNISNSRKRFTAAHELGHILLGHAGRYKLVNREPSPHDNPVEQSANVFASRLLAPACVLWGLGITNAQQIADVCNISKQSAEFRMKRLQELYDREKDFMLKYGRSCFLLSPSELTVYRQFTEYISKNRL